jgi:hypothetical protein
MARECHHGGGGPNLQVDHNGINKTTTSTVETILFFLILRLGEKSWYVLIYYK